MKALVLSDLHLIWIHGHTHHSMDYMLGRCRAVCNPRGYVLAGHAQGRAPENPAFDPHLLLSP